MTLENAESLLNKLDQDTTTQNFIAQSSARHILFSVGEKNFPNFRDNLDQGANSIAFSYISIGCFLAEKGFYDKSINPLQKGAEILEHCHKHEDNRDEYSSFYVLISALSYYAASQYSKSFILLKAIEPEATIAKIISLFLKKKFIDLMRAINSILLNPQFIGSEDDLIEPNGKIYQLLLARVFNSLLQYIYYGEEYYLENAKDITNDLLELSKIDGEPSVWWVTRLLNIIIDRFGKYSLWNTIPPFLPEGFKDNEQVKNFILASTFKKIPVVELFLTQEQALHKINNENGAVICLPTSSGKTRIAEIAILKSLIEHPESIVLFLAPFRSLAYEIEESLSNSFEPLNYKVTHLYGGSQFGKIDQLLIEESNIIVVTPEKAKAIIRADTDVNSKIKLVVIDEGHLLDETQRNVSNELFVEELKYYVKRNGGKIVLLSAVLPNSEEISQWITNNSDNFIRSEWRPASQKFGIMYFTGENLDIVWQEKEKTFNKNFITPFIPQGKRKSFPQNKKQAIAATAIKLSRLGAVLIFVSITRSVKGYAKEALIVLERSGENHQWTNTKDWQTFILTCHESLGEESEILKYAELGIICHGRTLFPQNVRLSIEKLMRNGNPRIVISTSTLAQGVNLGVSSVIIASAWMSGKPIDSKTFMNIAGRAGRAFTDSEGKILYAIDKTQGYIVSREENMAKKYFDSANVEPARSGLLQILVKIKQIAENCGIDFNSLLEIIAENDFSKFKDEKKEEEIKDYFDWIDDTLLALSLKYSDFVTDSSSEWIDAHFRESLAYIQVEQMNWKGEDLIQFLKARNMGIKKISGGIPSWKSHISTGLPLRSAIYIDEVLDHLLKGAQDYLKSGREADNKLSFLSTVEAILSSLPSSHFKNTYDANNIEQLREFWIKAVPMDKILEIDKELKICNNYFGYTLPWILNSIAKKLKSLGYGNEAEVFEELSVLSELGVPNFFAAKIYLAGIRSRTAATELSKVSLLNFMSDESPSRIAHYISSYSNLLRKEITETANSWVDVLSRQNSSQIKSRNAINFKIDTKAESNILVVRSLSDNLFLCSPDFKEKIKIDNESFLNEFANDINIYFEYNQLSDEWLMKSRNPHLTVTENF